MPGARPHVLLDQTDVVVIGAGAAGLYTALVAAEQGASVRLVSRSPLDQSASYRAQGGIAAALASDDGAFEHARETIAAARGCARESAVRVLCEEAPERVRELEGRGVPFDTAADGSLLLALEGGHSRRRIVHAGGSATGRMVASTLSAAAIAHERIEVHEQTSATRLWVEEGRCVGALTETGAMPAAATVLATGGAAALWQRTTNPRGAIGAALSLAHEAGAALADLELMQFHPTALVSDGRHDGFLVTEAVRGEGARLLDASGERFVDELAPRDEVTRAVHERLATGERNVLLDMRAVDLGGFPNIVEVLVDAGFDPLREPIPVAPAAHYMIGGVVTDLEGRATLRGLYAVGECSSTGVHGANRLASNSLAECFVFGRRAALASLSEPAPRSGVSPPDPVPFPPLTEATRAALWRDAGIVRSREGLERVAGDPFPLARLVARAALAREESRGCHLRSDFPDGDESLEAAHFVFAAGGEEPSLERWR